MPNGDYDYPSWKETFKFFIKELKEVYIPQLKALSDFVFPQPQKEPEEIPGEAPEPVPAPPPTGPYMPSVPYEPKLQMVGGEPPIPYDPPELSPDRTPFPPWDPRLPYGYDAGTPTPLDIEPGPPIPWWQDRPDPENPWWRNFPPWFPRYDYHFTQALPTDSERKA